MNATLTVLPENVCRIEGVPRPLLGRLMVRIVHHPGLEAVWKLAPAPDETALDLFGVSSKEQAILWRLLATLPAAPSQRVGGNHEHVHH